MLGILILSVIIVVAIAFSFGAGFWICKNMLQKELVKTKSLLLSSWQYQYLFIYMAKLKIKGVGVSDFIKDNNYKNIAIYGLSHVAEVVYEDLKQNDVNVNYFIDKNKNGDYDNVKIIKPEHTVENIDLIIICVGLGIAKIKNSLDKTYNCGIYSVEDILEKLS